MDRRIGVAALMAPRAFDRYMVSIGMGTHPKLAALSDGEFRAHVVGVLAIAAMAPVRGRLLVGALPAGAVHIARTAGVTERVATSALRKLQAIGVLQPDAEHDCLRVHDWEDVNPPPKRDTTAAERQRRYRSSGRRKRIPSAIKDEVMARDEGRCVRCGSEQHLEYHHRLRVVDGGTDDADNLEIRCFECHRLHTDHARVTPASRRNGRDGHAEVTPPEVEGEGEVPASPTVQQVARKRVTRRIDQSQLPDNFPDALVATVDAVLPILHGVWDDRGGMEPGRRGVALAVLRDPRAAHEQVARKLQHWLTSGKGRRAQCADVAARFGDWIEGEGAAPRPAPADDGMSELDRKRLASAQRLAGGAT